MANYPSPLSSHSCPHDDGTWPAYFWFRPEEEDVGVPRTLLAFVAMLLFDIRQAHPLLPFRRYKLTWILKAATDQYDEACMDCIDLAVHHIFCI